MKERILCILGILFLFVSCTHFDNGAGETDKILLSAESLFKAIKERDYPKTWTFLSLKSRDIIVNDVYKTVSKTGASYKKRDINEDFTTGGLLSRSYWNGYLEKFDPDSVLEESKWDMGKIGKDRAEIIVLHKKAQAPAILQMFREDGVWKMGLEETFRSSR
jgi:hypothetical protein